MLYDKKVTLAVYVGWSGSNVSVCIKYAHIQSDDDGGSCSSGGGMVVVGAGKSTDRLSNCQTIHMHIGSSASMPGNRMNRREQNRTEKDTNIENACIQPVEKERQKRKYNAHRMIYIKLLLLLGFFGYISKQHERNTVNK